MNIGYRCSNRNNHHNSQLCKLIKNMSHTKGINKCEFKNGTSWACKNSEHAVDRRNAKFSALVFDFQKNIMPLDRIYSNISIFRSRCIDCLRAMII
jgi:hypothetical protein